MSFNKIEKYILEDFYCIFEVFMHTANLCHLNAVVALI